MFKPSSKTILLTVPRRCFLCGSFLLLMFCVCHASLSSHCSLVVTCGETADLLACLNLKFSCFFVTFPCGVLGQVWCLIVSIPNLCLVTHFHNVKINLGSSLIECCKTHIPNITNKDPIILQTKTAGDWSISSGDKVFLKKIPNVAWTSFRSCDCGQYNPVKDASSLECTIRIRLYMTLPRRSFFCGSFMLFLSCLCYAFVCVGLLMHCSHLLGKGYLLALVCDV